MVLTLALVGIVMLVVFVPAIPVGLSFSWPYLSSTIAYGVYLAVAGFVSVLVGLAMVSVVWVRR